MRMRQWHEDSLVVDLNRLCIAHCLLLLDAPILLFALYGNMARHCAYFGCRVLDFTDQAGILEIHGPNLKLTHYLRLD